MEKPTSPKALNAVILGAKGSWKHLVGNIILGRDTFQLRVFLASNCEKGEGEVCGRRVTLVNAPGWLRGYRIGDTPELFKTEMILSVSLCPPGPHAFILVVNADLAFRKVHMESTQEHLQHLYGEKVWDHTIVLFTHRGDLGHETIEDYIMGEGELLQSLVKACGNRYHVLCDDSVDNAVKVKELFEKIDAMVAGNDGNHYEIESKLLQSIEERRREVEEKAEELRLRSQMQRKKLRALIIDETPQLRVLMLGWVSSGKSATGNNILSTEVFWSGGRTMNAAKQSGEVAGRHVVIVDTPGWWKFFPVTFTPSSVKSEILKGVSLCSPSPNVILLMLPLDTSFTEEQRKVTEGNMRLLGERVWRHVIVLFTCGDGLGGKTIEHHIESEGKPLHWLIKKCENRYHVLDNIGADADGAQVMKLLEKMEEMVAGNSSFYLNVEPGIEDGAQLKENSNDKTTVDNRDECATKEISGQLIIEWDRKNWEMRQILKGNRSLDIPPSMNESEPVPDVLEGGEEQTEHDHDQDKMFGPEAEGEYDQSEVRARWLGLLEREWCRREATMEQMFWIKDRNLKDASVISGPGSDELLGSRQKVASWLKRQDSQPCHRTSSEESAYGSASKISFDHKEVNE